ncbi:MAG TPA: DUF4123 domain-containing protein [Edaphobacter sp.]|jgi:hypothetical protein|nr:DUF4123 domain-containing protein [Edaphobacter sp.]
MKFLVEIVAGPRAGLKYPLEADALTIGRSPAASVPFPEDNFLSGTHCSFQGTPDGVLLRDLNSTNGTFLNGQRITQSQPRPGDLITAGSITMRIVVEPERRPPSAAPPATAKRSAAILTQFATSGAPLYCLLDAACDQTIPSLLALAQEQKQCLYDGQSATDLANWAPYLIKLPLDSPFTKALLDLGWGKGWASYFTSAAPFEGIRHHFRKFLMIQLQGGEELYFRFYDPRVLRDFLPTATPSEAKVFFGPVQQWLIESEDPQTMLILEHSEGNLVTARVSVAPPPD